MAAVLTRVEWASADLLAEGQALRGVIPRILDGRVLGSARDGRGRATGLIDIPVSPLLRRVFELAPLGGQVPGVAQIDVVGRSHGGRDVQITLEGGRLVGGRVRLSGHDDGTHALELRLDEGLGRVRMVFAATPGRSRTVAATELALHGSLFPPGPRDRYARNGAIGTLAGLRRIARSTPR